MLAMRVGVQDLEEEQVLLARLLHWLTSPHPDTHAAILRATHAALLRGGPRRLRTTLTALAFQTLVLHRWAWVPCKHAASHRSRGTHVTFGCPCAMA